MNRILARAVFSTTAVLMLSAAGAAPAFSAEPAQAKASAVHPDVPPPPCVTVSLDAPGILYQTVHVHNTCANAERVKVLAEFAPDSSCLVMAKKTSKDVKIWTLAPHKSAFDGLAAC